MMISPETYCWLELQGKSAEEILSKIRSLKQEIGRLKNIAEHPHYVPTMDPSEEVRIELNRQYLAGAKQAYAEAGGVYVPSRAEQKAEAFDKSLPYISKITFTIGGLFGGFETKTFTFGETDVRMYAEHSLFLEPTPSPYYQGEAPIDKEEFLDSLRDIHIGEWRTNYDTDRFGILTLDGTSWELTIEFSDGHKPVKCYGANAYPYNFKDLTRLFEFGYDLDDEED